MHNMAAGFSQDENWERERKMEAIVFLYPNLNGDNPSIFALFYSSESSHEVQSTLKRRGIYRGIQAGIIGDHFRG